MQIIQNSKGYEILAIIFDRRISFKDKVDKIIEISSRKNSDL